MTRHKISPFIEAAPCAENEAFVRINVANLRSVRTIFRINMVMRVQMVADRGNKLGQAS